MANRRGMHKVEFFLHIDEIKEMYDKGYVVLKILYEELKTKYNWSMSYWSFRKYMNEEIISKKETEETPKEMKQPESVKPEPVASPAPKSPKTSTKAPAASDDKERILQELAEQNPNLLGKWA